MSSTNTSPSTRCATPPACTTNRRMDTSRGAPTHRERHRPRPQASTPDRRPRRLTTPRPSPSPRWHTPGARPSHRCPSTTADPRATGHSPAFLLEEMFMPATALSEKPAPPRNGRRLPDSTILERVRAAFRKVDRQNKRRPGRPALAEHTGGTEHQVRRAMRIAASEVLQPEDLATRASPDPHQDQNPLESAAPPVPPPQAPPLQVPAPPDDPPPPSVLSERPDVSGGEADPPPERTADASDHRVTRPPSAWPLAFIGLAAAVAVWGGWVDLGRFTGFGMVQPLPGLVDSLRINTAIVLPIGIEAYGAMPCAPGCPQRRCPRGPAATPAGPPW